METASGETVDSWNLASHQPSMEFMLRDYYIDLLAAECGLDSALPMSLFAQLLRESVTSSGQLGCKQG